MREIAAVMISGGIIFAAPLAFLLFLVNLVTALRRVRLGRSALTPAWYILAFVFLCGLLCILYSSTLPPWPSKGPTHYAAADDFGVQLGSLGLLLSLISGGIVLGTAVGGLIAKHTKVPWW